MWFWKSNSKFLEELPLLHLEQTAPMFVMEEVFDDIQLMADFCVSKMPVANSAIETLFDTELP